MKKILIVEDDTALNRALARNMRLDGYEVVSVGTAEAALQCITSERIHLMILDVSLPDGNGYVLCEQMKKNAEVPVVFLTANDIEEDIIRGYDSGAEDYITKPFSMPVFRKKITAVLRRLERKEEPVCFFDDGYLKLDFLNRRVEVEGKMVAVAASDYKLLEILSRSKDRVFSKEMLVDLIWKGEEMVSDHAVAESVHRIRSKIESKEHTYIKTIYGMGYTWAGSQDEES